MKAGTIIEFRSTDGLKVHCESKTRSEPYELDGKKVIDIDGRKWPVPFCQVFESPRAIAAKNFGKHSNEAY